MYLRANTPQREDVHEHGPAYARRATVYQWCHTRLCHGWRVRCRVLLSI